MSFDWRSTLTLPTDVEVIAVASLSEPIRARLAGADDDYVVQRVGSRDSAKKIDIAGARLLQAFRQPRRIVDVIIALSRSMNIPAEQLLVESFPLLERLVHSGLLAAENGPHSGPLSPLLRQGDRLGVWTIQHCVRLLDDAEVYRASDGKSTAAIKRLRPRGVEQGLAALLVRETEVLNRLEGRVTPTVLDAGIDEKPLPWIALSWIEGVRADTIGPERTMDACLAIADAYAGLHEQNVLHGDVHRGNLLIDDADRVTLLDFALARVPGDDKLGEAYRGAAHGYWEPEYAIAALRGEPGPPVTYAGEQYAVGTLLDAMLTGQESISLPVAADDEWHAVLHGDRRCFADRGCLPWPSVELVLRRATAREPERRYRDMREFAEQLRKAAACPAAFVSRAADPIAELVRETSPGGRLFEYGISAAPRASFNFGAAGIAFALYRLARATDNGDLLSIAEVWQTRAEAALEYADGLYELAEFREKDLGTVSPYHTTSGIWFTRAMLARAIDNTAGVDFAIRRFVTSVGNAETEELDLTLGSSSVLLGAALLYSLRPATALRRLGEHILHTTWTRLDAEPEIGAVGRIGYLGIAHGWAGYLYSALAWARATATTPGSSVKARLAELSGLAEEEDDGLRIPLVEPGHPLGKGMAKWMDGWCHGQAGHVFLHLLAGRVLGDPEETANAVRYGETAFAGVEDFGNLCCGTAGRAYAMLALFRASG